MIAPPLNDTECLSQFTALAADGTTHPGLREVAARFTSTAALATWIRSLPQRDDRGDSADGPRVACDVSQRARLLADDPNCVERAMLYLAAAELIDPAPTRQLATVDVSPSVRHTFPVESGEPVILDPDVRRNALHAGVWRARNDDGASLGAPMDLAPVVAWLFDLATIEAEDRLDEQATARIGQARRAVRRLVRGGPVTLTERADVLFALRLAGTAAPAFGPVAADGYELARAVLSRLVTRPSARRQAIRIESDRAVYWGGKAIATYLGVGGVYDVAYNEVRRATAPRPRAPKPRPRAPSLRVPVAGARHPSAAPSVTPSQASAVTDEPTVLADDHKGGNE